MTTAQKHSRKSGALVALVALCLGGTGAALLVLSGCGTPDLSGPPGQNTDFPPGALPGTAAGAPCGPHGTNLMLYNEAIWTQPLTPATVSTTDPLRVYWTICNTGDTQGAIPRYSLVVQKKSGGTATTCDVLEAAADTLEGTVVPSCSATSCVTVSVIFQNVAGKDSHHALSPGDYEFTLDDNSTLLSTPTSKPNSIPIKVTAGGAGPITPTCQ